MYTREISKKYTISTIFEDIKGKIFIFNKENIYYIYYNNWENSMSNNYDLNNLGNILYTNHSILLLIALLILLLAMVGAIKINIK
jgi:NADH:ubiquinone oxidoreductase subunit 6 (subunit J)